MVEMGFGLRLNVQGKAEHQQEGEKFSHRLHIE
jgi:hypothetical protein